MSVQLSPQEQFNLITKGLQEVLNAQIIKDVLEKEQRPLKIYWGTAPTGKPHCGYFVPMIKLAHFLKAGCEVTVLVADLHAFLDNMKAPLEVVQYRSKYYEFIVKSILKSIGVPIDKLHFIVGSSYQRGGDYIMDLFKLSNVVSQNDAKRAGADVVKQVANPLLSGLIYPLMQAIDEEHLGVDAQFGGIDQRKIFVLAEENLPSLGYKKRGHLMNPMVPGLGQGGKMSASDPNSKIDIIEDPKIVKKKINSAYCAPGELKDNGLIAFTEFVIQPIDELKTGKDGSFSLYIDRPEKFGGPIKYDSIESLKKDYEEGKLSPPDLKTGVADKINELLKPIREEFENNKEFQEAQAKGYPIATPKQEKKVKKPKNKGSKYPGASASSTTTDVDPKTESDIAATVSSVEEATSKLDEVKLE
ncbi:TYS1 [Candida pseudojiufengensis]|uniref:TYS1 n=1 Tax=Candida pseudojiufengensis TaxID=497109 RepID=UPI002225AD3D|nr:TYS1 [Candida pseudojiufengensis]KAI5965758.1 TYS1 [Candida pseudojiufengensis]